MTHRLTAAASALIVFAAACSTGAQPQEARPAPGKGGAATVVLGVEAVRGLDPAQLFNLTPSGDANRLSAIFGLLFWSDASTGEVNPGLGESLTASGDGKEWTMKLRPGLTFSDGTPLDAEAVRFNYERIADPKTRSPLATLVKGATFEVSDERTLVVKLREGNRAFDRVIATSLAFVGSPAAIEKDPAAFAQQPVGAGPFMLKEWVRDDHMTLTRNPSYYRQGAPLLDTLTFKVIADPAQRVNAVASGQAQAAVTGSDLSFIQRAKGSGLQVAQAPAGGGPMLIFNTARAPFDDPKARKAVVLALDTKEMAQVVDPGSTAPDSLYGASSPFHPSASAVPAQDVAGAQRLLDELAATGKPLRFTVSMPASGFFRRTAEYLQSRLSRLRNIQVEIEVLDNAALDRKVFTNRDFALSAQIVPVADPEPNLYKLLHSDGQTNYMGYHDPEVDAALDRGRDSADEAERREAYATVERLVMADLPVLPYRSQVAYTVHSSKLTGLTLQGDGSLLYDRLGLGGS
ncbi:ABC transporter substrate-binding protein [Nonomuraea phyllanthi]|uniref:ABC transporter substrate-binding protein n=1 Tax=Nonomuraea phyllanthi TaxID=2219224 RepID=A0A5C4VN54_9ACTN|nr:ABC transporter substrate-binding protein [Nonomuraea phyllanthi]KAB8189650.1 ABC transporter substrate-binding protein [Nonomuraea phyllanthi]